MIHRWRRSHTEESDDSDFHHRESASGQDNPLSSSPPIFEETRENATSISSIDSTTTTLHTIDQAQAPRSRKHVVLKRGPKVHMRHVS
jgi:hypothetical protein